MSAYLTKDNLYSENMESIFFKKIFFQKDEWCVLFWNIFEAYTPEN